MLLALQIIVYTFSQSTGSFTMNNTDRFQMSDISIIQIFVKLCNCFIYVLPSRLISVDTWAAFDMRILPAPVRCMVGVVISASSISSRSEM